MTTERWRRVEDLYNRALELEEIQRAAFLQDVCAGDHALQDEVERLLAANGDAGSFLEEPAFEGAARELAQDRTVSEFHHLKPGTKLGQYEVREQIGQGGMGEVYKGYDSQLKRDVALKVLPDPFLRDSERLSRFRREAAMLASLNHPNIAAIHRLEESGGTCALVMEYVAGETLQERIRRKGAIPSEEALDIARQICEALEHAHEKGVIHRDLKPANVKITPAGKVKVLDFGLAKAFSSEVGLVDNHDAGTTSVMPTEPGRILGTPAYMSPEQAQGKAVDKRTDIWSFGCVCYELLTGKRAFPGDNVSQIIAAVLRNDPDWGEPSPEYTGNSARGIGTLSRKASGSSAPGHWRCSPRPRKRVARHSKNGVSSCGH
jgi:eukaryotic-like serine/threonine-protein kinase